MVTCRPATTLQTHCGRRVFHCNEDQVGCHPHRDDARKEVGSGKEGGYGSPSETGEILVVDEALSPAYRGAGK